MGRYSHIVSLRRCCYLLRFQKSAAMAQIRLHNVTRLLLAEFAKLESRHQALPGRDRRMDRLANLSHRWNILRRNRLFTKVWTEFLDRADILDRHGRRGAAMEVDHDVDVVA